MFKKIKAEGGLTRYAINRIYVGETRKEKLAICEKLEQESKENAQRRKEASQKRKEQVGTLVKKVTTKATKSKRQKEYDEYVESLYTVSAYLKDLDGIDRRVMEVDRN